MHRTVDPVKVHPQPGAPGHHLVQPPELTPGPPTSPAAIRMSARNAEPRRPSPAPCATFSKASTSDAGARNANGTAGSAFAAVLASCLAIVRCTDRGVIP